MRVRCRIRFATCVVALAGGLVTARPVAAGLGVFQGDPIDPATQTPYVILPGLPLVYPGADGVYGTSDDVVDTGVVGDVDLVVRTQGSVVAGAIPAPVAALASAPVVVAGGAQGTAGTRLPFQVIVSDGTTPPAWGSALAAPELDVHGALAIAYPDLDGDGVIGPTGAPGASVELQRQETMQTAGRRPAIFLGGVAADSMGVALGAPASTGGLGLALAAIGTTGVTPGLYFDGPWIATRLPYMLPLDPSTYFNSDGEPSADGVIEVELTREELLLPPPADPVLGGAYALPLDGSSPTTDLAVAVSGPAEGAVFATPVDPATFVADFARRLVPVVDAGGTRRLAEATDAITLANDGPGGTASVVVFLADLMGNAADPGAGGTSLDLEAGSGLVILAPDTDGDPRRETLPFPSAAYATLVVDDAGGGGPAGTERVVARLGGVPVASLRVTLTDGGGGTPAAAFTSARAAVARAKKAGRDRVGLNGVFATGAALDPATQAITLTLTNAGGVVWARHFAPGALVANKGRTAFRGTDANGAIALGRVRRVPGRYTVRAAFGGLDLGAVDFSPAELQVTLVVDGAVFDDRLACKPAKNLRATRCLK